MKPIEIHIEGYKIVISKDDEQLDIPKDKQDKNITIPTYPDYTIPTPTNPNPFVILTDAEITTTNTKTKGETPVRDRMVGKVSDGRVTD